MKNSRRNRLSMLAFLGVCALGLGWFRPRALADAEVRGLQTPARSRVNDVAWSPDGKTLLLGVEYFEPRTLPRGEAQLWNAASGTLIRALSSLPQNMSSAYRLNFAPDAKAVSIDCRIHDLEGGEEQILQRQVGHIGLLFSPDGKTLAGASKNTLALWNRNEAKPRAILGDAASLASRLNNKAVVPFINCAAFSPDSALIVTGHTDGEVLLWDGRAGKLARTLAAKGFLGSRGAGAVNVAFSPDGHTVAGTDALQIVLWDARDGREIQRITPPGPLKYSMIGLAFSPDGKTLAAGGPRFYPLSAAEELLRPQLGDVRGPRNTTRGEINLWDVASGRLNDTMQAGKWIIRLTYSPDGTRLATCGDDNTALLWQVPQG